MATEVIHSIRASGGDYTTLSAWEAAQQRDLVAANEIAVAEVYNDWAGDGLLTNLTVAGWTTSATNYVVIRAATGHAHDGTRGTGARLYYNNAGQPLYLDQRFTRVEDLEVKNSADSTGIKYAIYFPSETARISRCILSSPYRCLLISGTFNVGDEVLIDSCLFLPTGAVRTPQAFYMSNGKYDTRILNCTVGTGCSIGIEGRSAIDTREVYMSNCVSMASTPYSGTFSATGVTNNAASSGTPPGTSAYGSAVTSAAFVDSANKNYHLAPGSVLIGAGANQSSYLTKDIDGDAWPGSGAWDIGMDRYVSVAATPVLSILSASNLTATGARLSVDLTF